MTSRHVRQALEGGSPSALVWLPAWLVVLIGALVVLGGLVYFARRLRERRHGTSRAAPRPRRPGRGAPT